MTASMNGHALETPRDQRWATVTALPREDARVTDIEKVRIDRLTAAKQRRAAARTRDLSALLRDRPDLAGVHAPADFAVDAVLWCV
ncbi:MAG: hypothetical protein QOF53_1334 [Nocardioidaceae bacterium]|jgi:hypothetical protein|nr:hypothetical protein [Nocardioidaceae bacterium]